MLVIKAELIKRINDIKQLLQTDQEVEGEGNENEDDDDTADDDDDADNDATDDDDADNDDDDDDDADNDTDDDDDDDDDDSAYYDINSEYEAFEVEDIRLATSDDEDSDECFVNDVEDSETSCDTADAFDSEYDGDDNSDLNDKEYSISSDDENDGSISIRYDTSSCSRNSSECQSVIPIRYDVSSCSRNSSECQSVIPIRYDVSSCSRNSSECQSVIPIRYDVSSCSRNSSECQSVIPIRYDTSSSISSNSSVCQTPLSSRATDLSSVSSLTDLTHFSGTSLDTSDLSLSAKSKNALLGDAHERQPTKSYLRCIDYKTDEILPAVFDVDIKKELRFLQSCGDRTSTPAKVDTDYNTNSLTFEQGVNHFMKQSRGITPTSPQLDEFDSNRLAQARGFLHGFSPLCRAQPSQTVVRARRPVRRSLLFNECESRQESLHGYQTCQSAIFASEDEEAVYYLITKYLNNNSNGK